jgi:hypothetical protein
MMEALIEKLAELKRLSERQHEVENRIRNILLSGNYRVDLPCGKHVVVDMPDLVMDEGAVSRTLRMLLFLAGKKVATRTCNVILKERGVVFERIIGDRHKLVSVIASVAESLTLYEVILLIVLAKCGVLEGVVGDILKFAEEEARYVFND